jgi:N utilization substance protein B
MLYQLDQTGGDPAAVFEEFWSGRDSQGADRIFTERLVLGVISAGEALDGYIAAAAEHWRIERMAVVDRNVLRIAVFEMLEDRERPAVYIDEAIEVARKFGSGDSSTFINGILDAVRKTIESERA